MRSTICRLTLIAVIVAAASLVSQSAQAETVKVPFAFTANGKSFPAGTYTVQENVLATIVTLHSSDGSQSLSLSMGPGDPTPTDQRVVLRFRTSGDQHELDSIQYGTKITNRLSAPGHGRNKSATAASGQ